MGAAVLVVIGVLLIPELLSGPKLPAETAGQVTDESGVRRYTIDLARRSDVEAPGPVAEPAPAAVVEQAPPAEPEAPPVAEPAEAPPEPARVTETQAQPAAPAVPVAAVPAPRLPWAVQVGSFSAQATAERVSNELKARGYESFVVPFRTGTQTLYRVRIGPMPDRESADATVQKLRREGTGATVVSSS